MVPAERYAAAARSTMRRSRPGPRASERVPGPESARLEYAELRLDQVAAQMPVTSRGARGVLPEARGALIVPETRQAHHILIKARPKDDAAALAKARKCSRSSNRVRISASSPSRTPMIRPLQQGGDLGWAAQRLRHAVRGRALQHAGRADHRGPSGPSSAITSSVSRRSARQPSRASMKARAGRDRISTRSAAAIFGDRRSSCSRRSTAPDAI